MQRSSAQPRAKANGPRYVSYAQFYTFPGLVQGKERPRDACLLCGPNCHQAGSWRFKKTPQALQKDVVKWSVCSSIHAKNGQVCCTLGALAFFKSKQDATKARHSLAATAEKALDLMLTYHPLTRQCSHQINFEPPVRKRYCSWWWFNIKKIITS